MDFAHHVTRHATVEGQDFAAVGFHAQSSDKHEVEHEQQHDKVDSETHDAFQEPLPGFGDVTQHRPQVTLGPEIITGFLVN